MYRPYFTPVSYRAYFHAYEHLMRSLGGKPHWAKQHNVNAEEEKRIFGDGMERWLEVRHKVDPTGVFVNGYVKRHLMGEKEGKVSVQDLFAAVKKEVPVYVDKTYPGAKQTPVMIDQTTPPVYVRP